MNRISRHHYTGFIFSFLLIVTLAYSLYHRALFFAPEQVTVSVVILAAFIVGLLLLVFSRQFNPTIWLLPICLYGAYVLLSTLWSVDRTSAVGGAVVMVAAVSIGIGASSLKERWRSTLLTIISVSGGMVFLFALLASTGVVSYQDAILDNMMNSVFQYHNTFGSFELATAVIALALRLNANRVWVKGLYSLNASLCLVGVVASYSRWVWILTIVMLTLYFIGSLVICQGFQAFMTLVVALITTGISMLFTLRSIHQHSLKYAVLSIVISLLGGGADALLARAVQTDKITSKHRFVIIFAPLVVACVAIGIILIHPPTAIKSVVDRVHAIQFTDFSLQERLWYYGAALHMWLDHPLIGTGIGTWSTKFQAYQQFPYWSTRTHSVLMSQLVDFGAIGTLLWLSMIGSGIYLAVQEIRRNKSSMALSALLGALTLLIHALFDFDMDYPVILIIFFVLLVSGGLPRMAANTTEPHKAKSIVYLPMLGGVVIIGVFGTLLTLSETTQQKATQTKQLDEQISLLHRSLSYAQYNGDAQFQLVDAEWKKLVQTQSEADRVRSWTDIQKAQRLEPWNPQVQDFAALTAYQLGHTAEALKWSQQAFMDGPFSANYPELYMGITLWAGVGEDQTNRADAAIQWRTVLHTYNAVQQNVKSIENLPKDIHAERPYSVSAQMQAYVATAEFCMKDYKQSLQDINTMTDPGKNVNASGLREIVKTLDQMRLGLISNQQFAQVFEHASPTDKQQYQVLSNIK